MRLKQAIAALPIILGASALNAQIDSLTMDLNLKTKLQGNNGYTTLIPEGENMETKVYSRARLGTNFYFDKLEVRVAIQDVSTWGNRTSINKKGNVDFFEAWAKYNFTPNLYLKAGRQVLSYDNERLIGETDWAMQGRSFDGLKLGYDFADQSKLEAVVTYNNDGLGEMNDEGVYEYSIVDGAEITKSMQILHYQSSLNKAFQYSAIAMNNIVQTEEGDHNALTTVGANLSQNISPEFSISAFGYYQFGKNTMDQDKNAFDVSLNLNFKPINNWTATLGGEMLSGTKYDEEVDKNKSFSPLYGTNHKFNGFMDYFYSGNHFNGAGLNDLYLKNNFNFNQFGGLYLAVHYLNTNQEFAVDTDKYLGTEVDLVYSKKFAKNFLFNIGYSQMFASDSMKLLKGVAEPKDYQAFYWVG